MNKNFSLLLCFLAGSISAQQSYFQQEVNYKIDVRLDDQNHRLEGFEEFKYTNNSKETLSEIWIHLWPNAYKDDQTAFAKQELISGSTKFHFSNKEDRGFIDSLNFTSSGKSIKLTYHPQYDDIAKLELNKPLAPGETITISTPFRVKIPISEFSRLGHANQQYQICQWYPKPAVYDAKGWHPMPYLNQGEFYSEFGSFEVNITLPENYVLASSGNMVPNKDEAKRIEENVRITKELMESGFPKSDSFPPSSKSFKTVSYKLDNAHDFAWFADKRYHILRDSVVLKNSGRKIYTYSYFSNINAKDWSKGAEYVNDAVKYYSEWVGEYPYDVCKSVDGALSAGAGMEYPTITVISARGGPKALDNVTAHEVGHNWFYGILASNERDFPWMDEGMNSFYDERYTELKYGNSSILGDLVKSPIAKVFQLHKFRNEDLQNVDYLFFARRNQDQAMNLHSAQFNQINYGLTVYKKTAHVLSYLESWLGTSKFDEMMQAYYQKWKFKHPYPEDFKAHVKEFTGQDLEWLFNDLISSTKRVDYSIKKVSKQPNENYILVKNKGQILSPVSLTGYTADSSLTFWYDGFKGTQKLSFPVGGFEKFSVNYTGSILDFNPKNDVVKAKGLFKKLGNFRPGLITGLEHPDITALYFVPTVGYNYYNGFMGGVALHNIGILRKHLEFVVNPMFAFNSSTLAGGAQIDYFIRPVDAFFKSITIRASGEQYATRLSPQLNRVVLGGTMEVMKRSSPLKKSLNIDFRHIYLRTENYLQPFETTQSVSENQFNQLLLKYENKRTLNPFDLIADFQQNKRFVKASITANYRVPYASKNKGLKIRVFAGSFLWKSNDFGSAGPDVRFRLSGQNGSQDYLFDDLYLGRNETEGLLSQQMTVSDGGFKVFSFRGQTSDYLATVNLTSTIPGKIPIRLFADIGHYFNGENFSGPSKADLINYNAGVSLSLINEVFEIYVPLLVSNAIKQTLETNNVVFGERIRFVLNFRLANPITQIRNLNL
ncbi:MAG: M1 family metallopeptidase [Bacteroidia bacterium]